MVKIIEKRLCSKLKNNICKTKKSFSSGAHDLTIIIKEKAGNKIEETISFVI